MFCHHNHFCKEGLVHLTYDIIQCACRAPEMQTSLTCGCIRVTKLSNLWYLLHGSATTVRCGHNTYNLIGHREVVYFIWPPQFIVIIGHNWKVSEMPDMVTTKIPLTMVQRCQRVFILTGSTAWLIWDTLAFHYAVQNR